MKIVSLISRYLLGLVFAVFGLNGFLHFLPMSPMPGPAGAFMGALAATPYISVIMACQLIGGLLLLTGQFVPLGLAILAPIVFNILLFHLFLAPAGLPLALLVVILWLLTYLNYRDNFAGLFYNRSYRR